MMVLGEGEGDGKIKQEFQDETDIQLFKFNYSSIIEKEVLPVTEEGAGKK